MVKRRPKAQRRETYERDFPWPDLCDLRLSDGHIHYDAGKPCLRPAPGFKLRRSLGTLYLAYPRKNGLGFQKIHEKFRLCAGHKALS